MVLLLLLWRARHRESRLTVRTARSSLAWRQEQWSLARGASDVRGGQLLLLLRRMMLHDGTRHHHLWCALLRTLIHGLSDGSGTAVGLLLLR